MVCITQLVAVLCCLSLCNASSLLFRRSLRDYPDALCNDGTPGVYYSSQGEGESDKNFAIYLGSGSYCYTLQSCRIRCEISSSCTTKPDLTVTKNGILSNNQNINPHFHDFFKIYLHYCSSDMHTGNMTAHEENDNMYFYGRHIFRAMIEDLIENYGMGEADSVILSGSSAGGVGAALLCNYLYNRLPDVNVVCLPDAALFYPDIPQFGEGCDDLNEFFENANDYWNGGLDEFDPFSWWKNISAPLMIGMPLWDTFGMELLFCGNSTNHNHQRLWASELLPMMKQVSEEHPEMGMWFPGCVMHGMIGDAEKFSDVYVAENSSLSYAEVAGNWFYDNGPIQVWDNCDPDLPAQTCNPTCI